MDNRGDVAAVLVSRERQDHEEYKKNYESFLHLFVTVPPPAKRFESSLIEGLLGCAFFNRSNICAASSRFPCLVKAWIRN